LEVEIYPGFAAREVLYDTHSSCGRPKVVGIAIGDVGIAKDGSMKSNFERGVELRAQHTIFAEGCCGSLTKELMSTYFLERDCQPQIYALGMKEVWEVDPSKFHPGKIVHTAGWPLPWNTYGGSFMYHWEDNKVNLGFVVGLDYPNPHMNLFKEFQRWKTHPLVRYAHPIAIIIMCDVDVILPFSHVWCLLVHFLGEIVKENVGRWSMHCIWSSYPRRRWVAIHP
jgi:electron-transferring-flavoprotein dehydrogenase